MIRRSVRKNFRNVHWNPPAEELKPPVVFFANHHGWYDGYVMYHLVSRLKIPCLDWIEEFDTFPLFRYVGGMPYPKHDPNLRASTVKATIRALRSGQKGLILFADQPLHYPPQVNDLGRSLAFITEKVPGVSLVPVAIRYEFSLHERAEAFLRVGTPVAPNKTLLTDCHIALVDLLSALTADVRAGCQFDVLAKGTPSVNERWDMRGLRKK